MQIRGELSTPPPIRPPTIRSTERGRVLSGRDSSCRLENLDGLYRSPMIQRFAIPSSFVLQKLHERIINYTDSPPALRLMEEP